MAAPKSRLVWGGQNSEEEEEDAQRPGSCPDKDHDYSSFQHVAEQMVTTEAGEARGGGQGESGDAGARVQNSSQGGGDRGAAALIVFSAHGQVDKGEDIELYHYGEAQEDGVEGQYADAQLPVQSPLVEMDAEDLEGKSARMGLGGRGRNAVFQTFYLEN